MRTATFLSAVTVLLTLAGCDPVADSADADTPSAGGKADEVDGIGVTYGALASATTAPAMLGLLEGDRIEDGAASIADLGEDTMPGEVKALRKEIVKVRDYVDIFSYAYPKEMPQDAIEAGLSGKDLWRVLREDLDDGYETLGAFKDLLDGQLLEEGSEPVFDEDELAQRRTDMLAWARGFEDRAKVYVGYLEEASQTQLHDRKDSHMSKFYWVAADKKPKLGLDGLDNVARLARELAKVSLAEVKDINDVENILDDKDDTERFHDFRKQLRIVEKLTTYFPAVWNGDLDPAPFMAVISTTVDQLGDIEDLVIGLEALDGKPRHTREDEIDDMWDDFRKSTNDLETALDITTKLLER